MVEKSPEQAIQMLKDGNIRFVAGMNTSFSADIASARQSAATSQKPFAIVLGCADSRVPPELVFDQSLGSLFVVRVAGNVLTPAQIGSIEFAVQNFGSPLVLVLGHSQCGAVRATIDVADRDYQVDSPNVQVLVDCIAPVIDPIIAKSEGDSDQLLADAVTAHTKATAQQLLSASTPIRQAVDQGRLQVASAEYDLASGEVVFHA